MKQAQRAVARTWTPAAPLSAGRTEATSTRGRRQEALRPAGPWCSCSQGPPGGPSSTPVPLLLQIKPVPAKQESGAEPASPGQPPGLSGWPQLLVSIQGQTFTLCPQVLPSSSLSCLQVPVRIAPVLCRQAPWVGTPGAQLLEASSWAKKFPKNPAANSSRCTGALSLAAARRAHRAATSKAHLRRHTGEALRLHTWQGWLEVEYGGGGQALRRARAPLLGVRGRDRVLRLG